MAYSTLSAHELDLLTPTAIRIGRIERILRRGPADLARLTCFAGGSLATFKRDMTLLRDLGAVVAYRGQMAGGYMLCNANTWAGTEPALVGELRKWV